MPEYVYLNENLELCNDDDLNPNDAYNNAKKQLQLNVTYVTNCHEDALVEIKNIMKKLKIDNLDVKDKKNLELELESMQTNFGYLTKKLTDSIIELENSKLKLDSDDTVNYQNIPKDVLIDGICVAVQRAHSLRVLHRKLSFDAIKVFQYDENKYQVKLGDWDNAVFNPGNCSFKSPNKHTFHNPNHYITPEMVSLDMSSEYISYGFEYDMWGVGMMIFEVIYETKLESEIDIADFTNEWLVKWIDEHNITIPNAALYKIILKILLTTNPNKRASSYAIKNMCDGPKNDIFNKDFEVISDRDYRIKHLNNIYTNCPPIDNMLGYFIDNPDDLIVRLKYDRCVLFNCVCIKCNADRIPVSKTTNKKTYIMKQLLTLCHSNNARSNTPIQLVVGIDILTQSIINLDAPIVQKHIQNNEADLKKMLSIVSDLACGIKHLRLVL